MSKVINLQHFSVNVPALSGAEFVRRLRAQPQTTVSGSAANVADNLPEVAAAQNLSLAVFQAEQLGFNDCHCYADFQAALAQNSLALCQPHDMLAFALCRRYLKSEDVISILRDKVLLCAMETRTDRNGESPQSVFGLRYLGGQFQICNCWVSASEKNSADSWWLARLNLGGRWEQTGNK